MPTGTTAMGIAAMEPHEEWSEEHGHAWTSLSADDAAAAAAVSADTELMSAVDASKDQSYFLCQVPSAALANVIFPLGHMRKSHVKELAIAAGLATARKKESMGICFVGKRRGAQGFRNFLSQYLGESG